MGLSTTASYAILFTASLLMLSTLLNSIIYSYSMANEGMNNKNEIIEGTGNVIEIDRVIYNSSKIEIIAHNLGPKTLKMDALSIVVNGSIVNFTYQDDYWYPGSKEILRVNGTYDLGDYHKIQFKIGVGNDILATSEWDKIYALTSTSVIAYSYEGDMLWSRDVEEALDIAVDSYLYILNSTRILKYDLNGSYVTSFALNMGIIAIDAYNNSIYAISNSTFYIFDSNGNLIKSVGITDGRDVAVGKYVYVLEGNSVYNYDYSGNSISSFTDSRITNATKIAADWNMQGNYVLILNNHNEILVYENGTYKQEIPLQWEINNLDLYGKIYLSTLGIWGMDIGYRVKLVDEYGNEVYTYL